MFNRDDPKAKEDSSSNVGGEETTMQSPRDVDESEENANEKEEEKESSDKVEEKESSEVEEDNEGEKEVVEEEKEARDEEKEVGEEEKEPGKEEKDPKEGDKMKLQRNDEEAEERTTQSVREHETESHAEELLALEAIPSLRNHFRESVNGARPGYTPWLPADVQDAVQRQRWNQGIQFECSEHESCILVATAAEKEILESIGMGKESCGADDNVVHQSIVEGPTIPAIGGGSNNAKSGQTDAYSVEAPGVEPLKAMEGRLMNAISDGTKEVNKKVKSLSDRLTLVENEVKSLRVSVSGMRELSSEGESDNPFDQDGSDNPSEEDGSDTPSEEDGGDTLSEAHKDGEMSAAAEQLETEMLEKENAEKKKKKRARKDDGKELLLSKQPKVCDRGRSPIWTRAQEEAAQKEAARKEAAQKKDAKLKGGEKKQTKNTAEKKAAQKEAAAQKKAAKKMKTCRKNKQTKKRGKKTL
ncbi:hypothetical protein HID58_013496 [Brassica napus]|uniref:Uncharacterized protein n=2 Tax=Brassica napus TaxID=3708 RepID=A0ABQ8E416_BRANA|nr:hypothetical protein HID58_013496 [Brassica napus]